MTTFTTPQFPPAEKAVKPVQVLKEDGTLVKGASAGLDDEQVLEALRYMMIGRAMDERCWSMQRQGKLGTFAPIIGQEAAIMGSSMALDPARDWLVPQYRELPAQLRHGHPGERIIIYRQGNPAGGELPAGVKVMPYQVSLAAQLPHAVGLAWGMRLQEQPGVAIVYFGDGASSEGDFHESCNLAGAVSAPVIFFLQNNQWAISTPRSNQSATADLASRAPGYGFPGVSVDGNDLLAVYQVTADAVARGLAGEGPTLIEAQTYRMWAHTTADDPTRYMDPDEKTKWKGRDPIERVQRYLEGQGGWSEEVASKTAREVEEYVDDIFDKAAAFPPPEAGEIYEHIFDDSTPSLARHRQWHLNQ